MNPLLAELKPILSDRQFNDLAHLPPTLELVKQDYIRASVDDVRSNRAVFGRDVKPAFFVYLADEHTDELKAMGLNTDALTRMKDGRPPENRSGEQLDASIDHIKSLNFNGTNDFENLTLVPTRFNALKDTIENLQFQRAGKSGTLITITPKNRSKVPYIEGGFKRARLHA